MYDIIREVDCDGVRIRTITGSVFEAEGNGK